MEDLMPKVGQRVIYINEHRVEHQALVTAVWTATCVNLVYVTADEAKVDSSGRQIERAGSVTIESPEQCVGRSWRYAL